MLVGDMFSIGSSHNGYRTLRLEEDKILNLAIVVTMYDLRHFCFSCQCGGIRHHRVTRTCEQVRLVLLRITTLRPRRLFVSEL